MHRPFLDAATPAEVRSSYLETFDTVAPVLALPLIEALGRPLARPFMAPANLPGFDRSAVDGYAVRARDTFGASASNPVFVTTSPAVTMAVLPTFALEPGTAAPMPTGGALPPGADSVVMIEDCDVLDDSVVGLRSPVGPWQNVVRADDDTRVGEELLSRGRLLRPPDTALLAAFGLTTAEVHGPLVVAHLATGDEIVPPETSLVPAGCVRNVNGPLVAAIVRAMGHTPLDGGIVGDSLDAIVEALRSLLARAHVVLLSGGSSAGARDFTTGAIESLPEGRVDVHGIRVSPGKPTVLGRSGGTPVVGLPGHPASCAVVMERFVKPLIRTLAGERPTDPGPTGRVPLLENVASRPGREEYVRVRLEWSGGRPAARPIRGPSGAVSTLVRADGLLRIPLDCEGLAAGAEAEYFAL